ncbi:MAG: methionyl-tRNA formyltransferase [Pseudomonadales bacterium]|nr:methionyl-tRNA formyltransferase [Pseudomonadales bacterium]
MHSNSDPNSLSNEQRNDKQNSRESSRDTHPLRIIFAGTPDFAASSLKALLANHYNVIAVYTQPDRPAGRGRKLLPSPVKAVALEADIPVYQPLNFKAEESLTELQSLQADLMIVAAYGLLLPLSVLNAPRLGCVNIHASLLPRWRGAAPIQRAIEAGDKESGITIMQMDEGLDTGDKLLEHRCHIDPQETGGTLHDKLAVIGAEAILDYLRQQALDALEAEPQDDSQACYAHKLSKQEGQIDWNQPADVLDRKIRALTPWPGAFTVENNERVKVLEAHVDARQIPEAAPGTIIGRDRTGIVVQCGDKALVLTRIQLPGNKAISTNDLINGGKQVLMTDTVLA